MPRELDIFIILVDGSKISRILRLSLAGVAQLVEHHLAKVDVESSSLFARSIFVKRLKVTSGAFSCLNILTIGSCEIVNLAF